MQTEKLRMWRIILRQSSQPQADEQSLVGYISKEGVHQRTILLSGPARGLGIKTGPLHCNTST